MRKTLLALATLVILATVTSTATAATNQITLGGTATDTLTFKGSATGWTLTFASNTLSGTATGQGTLTPISGTYDINSSGITITGTSSGAGTWNISQSGGLGFEIESSTMTDLLSGTLQLINLAQTGSTGTFNYDLAANLTVSGGSDASLFGSSGVVGITIDFDTPTSLSTIVGTSNTLGANVSSGEVYTPEPMSMVLVGSGLILLGGLARRRRTTR